MVNMGNLKAKKKCVKEINCCIICFYPHVRCNNDIKKDVLLCMEQALRLVRNLFVPKCEQ